MYKRVIDLASARQHTCFLWGPRQTGNGIEILPWQAFLHVLWSELPS